MMIKTGEENNYDGRNLKETEQLIETRIIMNCKTSMVMSKLIFYGVLADPFYLNTINCGLFNTRLK